MQVEDVLSIEMGREAKLGGLSDAMLRTCESAGLMPQYARRGPDDTRVTI